MRKPILIFVTLSLAISLACQALAPTPTATSTPSSTPTSAPTSTPTPEVTASLDCARTVHAVDELQPTDIPDHLIETAEKRGDEFDVNAYFDVLTHISMQEGYALDYAFYSDFLGSAPVLYARPVDREPYKSASDVPAGTEPEEYLDHLAIQDAEPGYFEAVVLKIMGNQFYLFWHANYNDLQIVCDPETVDAIVKDINDGDFGMKFNSDQMSQVRRMTNIEPTVKLTADSVIVEVIVFTKWGGFFKQTYTISRSFPHTIEMDEENLVEYDCGIMF
ncbi:MAG: hypothetical protein AB1750_14255 [Chloroflexota bacterium]